MHGAISAGTSRGAPSAVLAGAPPGVRPSFLAPPPARRSNMKNSNREPLGLESHLTLRKQRIGYDSNREKTRGLRVRNSARGSMGLGFVGEGRGGPPAPPGLGGPYISRRFCTLSLGPNHAPGAWWGAPGKRRSREGYPGPPLQRKWHLRFLFRLKPAPTLYFLQLTGGFN